MAKSTIYKGTFVKKNNPRSKLRVVDKVRRDTYMLYNQSVDVGNAAKPLLILAASTLTDNYNFIAD